MSIDKSKLPPMWAAHRDERDGVVDIYPAGSEGWPEMSLTSDTMAGGIAQAHGVMAIVVKPYVDAAVTEALERIAKWLETDGLQDAVGNSVAGLFHAAAHEVREMATGARPLPGGKP